MGVSNLAVRVHQPVEKLKHLAKHRQKFRRVLIEKRLSVPPLATGRHMMRRTGVFPSPRSGHDPGVDHDAGMLELLDMRLTLSTKPGGYSFKSCLKNGSLGTTTMEPQVDLTIGDDHGEATLDIGYAKFGKGSDGQKWVFPPAK
jgi:hypothetical protein